MTEITAQSIDEALRKQLDSLSTSVESREVGTVIQIGDGIARVDGDGDMVAELGQRLIDGVVHDLVDQMVQTGGRRRADIHTRTLPNRLQTLKHLDL